MKKYKILLISLIICFICTLAIGLTACTGATGETGAQGEQGIQGEKGDKGDTGDDGDDGLSAYELYVKNNPDYTGTETEWLALLYGDDGLSAYELYLQNNPDYTGTEAQWLDDLINGKLATVTYTVTFNSEGGSAVESQTVSRGGKITEPATPTLAGHTFLGWYVGEEKWSFLGYSVTENVTLTAKWSVTNTDITYTLNNETETYEVTAYSGTDEVIDILPAVDNIAVTAIVANAFKGNTSITTVIIPETVTSIGANAFDGCSNLATVTMPSSLTNLGSQAFANTAVKNVYYNGDLSDWLGITFGSGSSNPMFYGAALYFTDTESNYELVESVTITGVTAINSCAFYGCTSLTSVTIGADVTSIGDYAFKECSNLTTVDTQGTSVLATIGAETFYGCTALTSITIPATVTSFGGSAFNLCASLTGVYYQGTASQWAGITFGNASANPLLRANNLYLLNDKSEYELATDITITGIEKINDYAFYNATNLTSVEISSGVTAVGASAFYGCTAITSVTIPATITSFGTDAFPGSSGSIASVYYGGTIDQWAVITFGNYAANPSLMANLYLANANSGYDLATDVTINVATISAHAFRSCYSLTSVTLGDTVETIGERAFYSTKIASVTLGKNVSSIEDTAFNLCTRLIVVYNLSSLTLTAGNTDNGYVACYATNVYTDTTTSGGTYVQDGFTFLIDNGKYYLINYTGTETDITLPALKDKDENAISYEISQRAFYQNTSITSVVIPDNVTAIGVYAFGSCTYLTSVTIGSNVTSIATNAFNYCYHLMIVYNLSTLSLTKGNSANGYVAYYAIAIYTDVNSKGTYLTQNDFTFYINGTEYYLIGYSGSQTELTLPTLTDSQSNTIKYEISPYAFYYDTSITSVVIPDCVTAIGEGAFYLCSNLANVTLGNGITTIPRNCFYRTAISAIVIPEGVTSIYWYAFGYCPLTSIVLPTTLKTVDAYVFQYVDQYIDAITVYYNGTASQYSSISKSSAGNAFINATVYYYSENQPTETGNYWHYVESVITIWTDEQTGE